MKENIEEVKNIITKPMEDMGITVHSVKLVTEHNHQILKIILDKVNGLDLDTIVEATNVINPLMDKYDLIKDEYILDISSKERGQS